MRQKVLFFLVIALAIFVALWIGRNPEGRGTSVGNRTIEAILEGVRVMRYIGGKKVLDVQAEEAVRRRDDSIRFLKPSGWILTDEGTVEIEAEKAVLKVKKGRLEARKNVICRTKDSVLYADSAEWDLHKSEGTFERVEISIGGCDAVSKMGTLKVEGEGKRFEAKGSPEIIFENADR